MDKDNLDKYNSVKNELDVIYNHIREDIGITSNYNWYEHDEKSTKPFLNLEKQQRFQKSSKNLLLMIKKPQTKHTF